LHNSGWQLCGGAARAANVIEGRARAEADWGNGHSIKVMDEVVLSHLVNLSSTLGTDGPRGT